MSSGLIKLRQFVDASYLEGEFQSSFKILLSEVLPPISEDIKEGKVVYPPGDLVLRAFKECPLNKLRVIILGQDPYHDGRATGLAFDNSIQFSPSPSLRAILDEIESDTGKVSKAFTNKGSYLEHLPEQGVLLLNTALTVLKGNPASHSKYWKKFTVQLLKACNTKNYLVWVLWGGHAKSFSKYIDNPTHFIISGAHPSPLAQGKFKGGKYFSNVNEFLFKNSFNEIIW